MLVRLFRLEQAVVWLASAEGERQDILATFPRALIFVMPEKTLLAGRPLILKERIGPLKLLCLGRVAPIKGLYEGLQILEMVESDVAVTIAGAIEDPDYAGRLRDLIEKLPSNVSVTWLGHVSAEDVPELIRAHDALLAPSKSENFGHSIAESLALGRPVFTTARTPWRIDANSQAVIEIDPAHLADSARSIQDFAQMSHSDAHMIQWRAHQLGLLGLQGGHTLQQVLLALDHLDFDRN
jgi:hypothetical protein